MHQEPKIDRTIGLVIKESWAPNRCLWYLVNLTRSHPRRPQSLVRTITHLLSQIRPQNSSQKATRPAYANKLCTVTSILLERVRHRPRILTANGIFLLVASIPYGLLETFV